MTQGQNAGGIKNRSRFKTGVLFIVIAGAVGITIWYHQYYVEKMPVSEFFERY